ncbi:MAG: heme-binding protein, partial [Rhodospirillales bacterium]|nr:heme-binding protein [Rhodospirillales bacterium]
ALTPEQAVKAAQAALGLCRTSGFQVSVAVVDRGGNVQVIIRDRYAGPHTPDASVAKAWTAVSFRTNTSDLVNPTLAGKLQSGARNIPGALMLGGGVIMESNGLIVGGIGVSGAPGGAQDEYCAKAGLEAVTEALNF